jgi:hypothetical protein
MWLARVADVVAPTLLAVSQCFPYFVRGTSFGIGLQVVAGGGARCESAGCAAFLRCSLSYYHFLIPSRGIEPME